MKLVKENIINAKGGKQLNSFEQNYWGSYCDFLDHFKSLTYLGISIPLVLPYYVLVMKSATKHMKSNTLKKVLKTKITLEKDLQPQFEKRLSPYRRKVTKTKGKVVLFDTVLRIPDQFLKEHFRSMNTLILQQKKDNSQSIHHIPSVPFTNFINVKDTAVKSMQKKATKLLANFRSHPIFNNTDFKETFLKLIPTAMKHIAGAKKFFDTTAVSCLVVGTTNSSDTRSLAVTAMVRGIPTICLQHGVPMLEFGYLPKVATFLGVYGKYDKEWYAKKGISPKTLKIIGHPRMDEIFKRKPMEKKSFQTQLKLSPEKKSVLLIMHHEEVEMTHKIIQQLKNQGKYNIVVKKRNGKQRKTKKTLELLRNHPDVSFADNIHLYDLIQNVDAVISYESTTILEALLANKPVFIWKLNSLIPSTTNYYIQLQNYIFKDSIKLVESLTNTLESETRSNSEKIKNEFLAYKYPDKAGTSTIKLKALIQTLIP